MKHFPSITELTLNNNPFCDEIDETAYLDLVKEHCPKIEILVFPTLLEIFTSFNKLSFLGWHTNNSQ